MKVNKIDYLNTFLILLSFGLAYFLPFQLFLFAYAILGPLHYFTEINWIRDKKYFVNNTNWIYITLSFAFLLSIPFLLKLPFFDTLQDVPIIQKLRFTVPRYLNALFLIGIISAFSFVIFQNKRHQYIIISLAVILAILLHEISIYHIIIGVFLPTVIHVYIFTVFFMWYGNLKSKSWIGIFNIILMILIPVIIIFLTIDQSIYKFSDTIKATYIGNSFHLLNVNLSKILGISDGTTFFFYEKADLKIQMFIAFAYMYHYLNWFSKTTVIGWHKKLTKKRSVFILILWVGSVGLYFYDYGVGLSILLFSSFLHVFMEFPLNIISIKEISRHIFSTKKL
ncbi:hypothetical protein [Aquimarina sp. 2201CG5-10]|uniref:hypothetical protein n=1 Tax=Aquimarina callyspongiae TaxID=3098150 RepID=UPI002AB4D8CB|nr:hypothetical protein [Aquimarina sp. 2201CG5-10]MDY8135841.1 hypothetical protein [Aquimarina sp. 2201CG5-10]